MLTVDQYEYIRIAHRVYGKKIREITRETGHSRNTVKKGDRHQRFLIESCDALYLCFFEAWTFEHCYGKGEWWGV